MKANWPLTACYRDPGDLPELPPVPAPLTYTP